MIKKVRNTGRINLHPQRRKQMTLLFKLEARKQRLRYTKYTEPLKGKQNTICPKIDNFII